MVFQAWLKSHLAGFLLGRHSDLSKDLEVSDAS